MIFKQIYFYTYLFCLLIFSFSSLSYAQNPTNDLLFAVANTNLKGVSAALKNGADPSAHIRELLYDLNYYTTADSIPSTVRNSASSDETALHYATRSFTPGANSIAIIDALLAAQADVNAPDSLW